MYTKSPIPSTTVKNTALFCVFKILDEVEKRRAISPALVQPFMRGIMEAPFPAPGRTITVKNFLPGSGTEVTCWWKRLPVKQTSTAPVHVIDCLWSHPAGDRAVQAVRFPTGTCRLWMPLFLSEPAPPPSGVRLSAPGAQGHFHSWQTQVCSSVLLV